MRYFGHIAKLVREARLKHPERYSQTELSSELGYKNGQFISNIERGLCSVPVKSLALLAKTLDIDSRELKEALLKDMEQTLDNYLAQGSVDLENEKASGPNSKAETSAVLAGAPHLSAVNR